MPAIQFSGLASGLDTAAIINSLVEVQRIPIPAAAAGQLAGPGRIGIIDELSSALSALKTKATDIDTAGEFLSYTGTLSDESAAKVTTSGDAVPGQLQSADQLARLRAADLLEHVRRSDGRAVRERIRRSR